MIRAWFHELLIVGGAALMLTLLGLFIERVEPLLVLGALGYLSWHLGNFLLLQRWIGGRRGSNLPTSYGVWEAVFDGLQREQLRKRKRGRSLIASLAGYRKAAEALPDAFVVLSEDGTVRWSNRAAGELLGLNHPKDLGKNIADVVTHPALEDDMAKGQSSQPLEVPSPTNGAYMLSLQITAPFGSGPERILVARDITSMFRLERTRRDFLASVSHELRTPITVFRGYLEALQETATFYSQWRTPLDHMNHQARRMQALVDDLLTLSRLEMISGPPVKSLVPVPDILFQIAFDADVLSGEKCHDIQIDADPAIWLLGEETDLRSVFSNLIFNAVRHTPPGTRINIVWGNSPNGAELVVQDRGPGIAASHLPRLTERFYRVDAGRSRDSGGSGLGLAIVKQVLDRYGATLKIESKVKQGTVFSICFPSSMMSITHEKPLSKAS